MHVIRLIILAVLSAPALIAAADTKGPYILSVDDVRDLEPGPEWNPSTDDVLVQVRGYLRNSVNLYLYPTKDQALLDEISGVLVSDEGEGKLRENCSDGFVELVAKLCWMETEKRACLVPTAAKKLTLRERDLAEEKTCWKADN